MGRAPTALPRILLSGVWAHYTAFNVLPYSGQQSVPRIYLRYVLLLGIIDFTINLCALKLG